MPIWQHSTCKRIQRIHILLGMSLCLLICASTLAHAQTATPKSSTQTQEKKTMSSKASGTFDVKVTPVKEGDNADSAMGRMLLDKQYHGPLEAKAQGQMLTAMTPVQESGAYVAVERVSGALNGRRGSFMLQHNGTMTRGVYSLSITVVPDSGTEELTGLTGKLNITITEGKHFYDFEYSLPDKP